MSLNYFIHTFIHVSQILSQSSMYLRQFFIFIEKSIDSLKPPFFALKGLSNKVTVFLFLFDDSGLESWSMELLLRPENPGLYVLVGDYKPSEVKA